MPAKRKLASAEEAAAILAVASTIGNNLFVGQRPDMIGAVLSELMATYLLNYRLASDLPRQTALREEILTTWVETVRHMVAVQTDPPATETMQ